MTWSHPIVSSLALMALSLTAGCTHVTRPDTARMELRSYRTADLQWEVVRNYDRAEPAPEVTALRFEMDPPVRQGAQLLFTGHLINPAAVPVPVIISLEPFGVRLVYENGLDWKPPFPGFPRPVPAPPPPARIIVPPTADVPFTYTYDLRTIAYSGSPEVRFDWYFSFLSRPHVSGTLTCQLPPAGPDNVPFSDPEPAPPATP